MNRRISLKIWQNAYACCVCVCVFALVYIAIVHFLCIYWHLSQVKSLELPFYIHSTMLCESRQKLQKRRVNCVMNHCTGKKKVIEVIINNRDQSRSLKKGSAWTIWFVQRQIQCIITMLSMHSTLVIAILFIFSVYFIIYFFHTVESSVAHIIQYL